MTTKNKIENGRLQIIKEDLLDNHSGRILKKREGFSLIEVLIGITLVAIALLGLAQLFTYSVMNNSRSDRMTNAVFLAQEQIDALRNLTATELSSIAGTAMDEQIDVNNDSTIDFRRITEIQTSGVSWDIRVLVFSPEQMGVARNALLQNPTQYRVKADISTIISR